MASIFRVNTNVLALNGQRNLFKTSNSLNRAMERLSSGLRVNRAADDAAGLSASEGMRSEIVGAQQANRNISQAISLLQTADGGLDQIGSHLLRLKALYVQAADDTFNTENRKAMSLEALALMKEIDRVAATTKFNNKALIDTPGGTGFQFYVGSGEASGNELITVTVNGVTSDGSTQIVVGGSTFTIKPDTTNDFANAAAADDVVDDIENAILKVASLRTEIGAAQNRLERAQLNIQTQLENTMNAESIIRNADFAEESANLTRAQILVQSGTALLAQANVLPQNALTLLPR